MEVLYSRFLKVKDSQLGIYRTQNQYSYMIMFYQHRSGIPEKAHDLPPFIVRGRSTSSPIVIETLHPENLPIDDVLQFEVSKLPDIMEIDDETCLFPPLYVLGSRVISSKFFSSREIFWKETEESFSKKANFERFKTTI